MELREIGPSFVWKLRRTKIADPEAYKLACKKPKLYNVEKKNVIIYYDLLYIGIG
jgi:hypothetical protein